MVKGVQTYNTITKLLLEERKQHNEGKRFEVKLGNQLRNMKVVEKKSREQIGATNNIDNLENFIVV